MNSKTPVHPSSKILLAFLVAFLVFLPNVTEAGDKWDEGLEKAMKLFDKEVESQTLKNHFWIKGVNKFVQTSVSNGEKALDTIVEYFYTRVSGKGYSDLLKLKQQYDQDHKTLETILKEAFAHDDVLQSKLVKELERVEDRAEVAMKVRKLVDRWYEYDRVTLSRRFYGGSKSISDSYTRLFMKFKNLHYKVQQDRISHEDTIEVLSELSEAMEDIQDLVQKYLNPQKDKDYNQIVQDLQKYSSKARSIRFEKLATFCGKFQKTMLADIRKHEKHTYVKDILSWPKEGKVAKFVIDIEKELKGEFKEIEKRRQILGKNIQDRKLDRKIRGIRSAIVNYEKKLEKYLFYEMLYEFNDSDLEAGIYLSKGDLNLLVNQKAKLVKLLDNNIKVTKGDNRDNKILYEARDLLEKCVKLDLKKTTKSIEKMRDRFRKNLEELKKLRGELEARKTQKNHKTYVGKLDDKIEIIKVLNKDLKKLSGKMRKTWNGLSRLAGIILPLADVSQSADTVRKGIDQLLKLKDLQIHRRLEKLEKDFELYKKYGIKFKQAKKLSRKAMLAHQIFDLFKEINNLGIDIGKADVLVDELTTEGQDFVSLIKDDKFAQALAKGDGAYRQFTSKVPKLKGRISFNTFEDFEQHVNDEYLVLIEKAETALKKALTKWYKIDSLDTKAGTKDISGLLAKIKQNLDKCENFRKAIKSEMSNLKSEVKEIRKKSGGTGGNYKVE